MESRLIMERRRVSIRSRCEGYGQFNGERWNIFKPSKRFLPAEPVKVDLPYEASYQEFPELRAMSGVLVHVFGMRQLQRFKGFQRSTQQTHHVVLQRGDTILVGQCVGSDQVHKVVLVRNCLNARECLQVASVEPLDDVFEDLRIVVFQIDRALTFFKTSSKSSFEKGRGTADKVFVNMEKSCVWTNFQLDHWNIAETDAAMRFR